MADNCGMCLALAEKYGCGWCQVSDSCEVKEQCDLGAGVWLNRNQTCPNPEVTDFEPQLGPWEGGTNITIKVKVFSLFRWSIGEGQKFGPFSGSIFCPVCYWRRWKADEVLQKTL